MIARTLQTFETQFEVSATEDSKRFIKRRLRRLKAEGGGLDGRSSEQIASNAKRRALTPHPLSVISDPFNQTKSTARVHQALQMGDGSSQPWVLLWAGPGSNNEGHKSLWGHALLRMEMPVG